MKMNIAIPTDPNSTSCDNITIDITETEITWTHVTGATVKWAATVADCLTRIFPKFKVSTFSFTAIGSNNSSKIDLKLFRING